MLRRSNLLVTVLLGGWLLGQPSGVLANDSMATFGAGGLQFQKTDDLQMTSEELYLSPEDVRVSYSFRNLTNHDVAGTVAFPMPEIDLDTIDGTPGKFHASSLDGDIFDFHIEVGGRSIKPQADVQAFVKGRNGIEKDVSGLLKKYRLPAMDPESRYGALDAEAIKELVAAGMVEDDKEHHPRWLVRTTFHWEQVFPAGQTTEITHRYKPVTGGSFHFGTNLDPTEPSEWCFDEAFASALKKLPGETMNEGFSVAELRLEYILKTGANWAGPISRFHLEIDKAGADLLSLCPIPGLKLQRRGHSFVAEASQYVPTTDIKLLFVYRACERAPCGDNPDYPGYPR